MKLKEKEEIIAEKDGVYGVEFDLENGSNYLVVEAEDYTGELKLEVE